MAARSSPPPVLSRRQEYAAATRGAIIQAARELFAQQGFFATRVEDIAARARVAPATVYTSVGGKHALLTVLMEQLASWQPREQIFKRIAETPTSHEVLLALARGTRSTREEWADVQRVITETAPHDEAVAGVHAERVERYRAALDAVADRLAALEGPTFDRGRAAALLWFYFGPSSYLPLHEDFGWSYEETETWLLAQCEHALNLK
ncbi:MAG: TetR/AcrR family transcriptional regulator [Solirubrobacteraceae bacterium]